MKDSYQTPARIYAKGIGDAVADRTINRKIVKMSGDVEVVPFEIPRRDDIALDNEIEIYAKSQGLVISQYHVEEGDDLIVRGVLHVVGHEATETWEDVAYRVALGNSALVPKMDMHLADLATARDNEFHAMHHHLRQASVLMSGRHLQHGDETQETRNLEIFTNCATSAMSFLTFYLLLNGAGVGRSYDDDMMLVDWSKMPVIVTTINQSHKDAQSGEIVALDERNARHLYAESNQAFFKVLDSREGWAQAIEKIETMAYEGTKRDTVLILDFSDVRPRGSPIGGMQGRPASGPGPLMQAINNVAKLRDAGMKPWRAAMYADHYFAECVLVGGARRAARMATKYWKDEDVLDFIQVKRGGFLWSSNNSVMVDEEFWKLVTTDVDLPFIKYEKYETVLLAQKAKDVFNAICDAAYNDQTGEPGLINVDKLTWDDRGIEALLDGKFAESHKYKLEDETLKLSAALAEAFAGSATKVLTNPCGEIVLGKLGGYCVIGDVVPYHSTSDDDAEDSFRVTTRALIRTNLMNSMYGKEVARTNRIGVGITGLHEYAWSRFGFGWKDMVNEEKSKDFWLMLSRFKRGVQNEAKIYSEQLGVTVPHTDTTIKPAGTTSKLFGLTEGAHLPPMREYLRWVQFRNDDPLIAEYEAKGYPIRKLKTYSGTTIVGFPTKPTICSLGMGDKLVTAAEASPEEQYQYLRLLEKYWLTGVEEDGVTPLRETGNQISYTLKYLPEVTSFEEFKRTLLEGQRTIRCCSVMPQSDTSAYEYLPEQPVNKHEFEMIANAIKGSEIKEDIGFEHVECSGGVCPISFNENKIAA